MEDTGIGEPGTRQAYDRRNEAIRATLVRIAQGECFSALNRIRRIDGLLNGRHDEQAAIECEQAAMALVTAARRLRGETPS